VKVKCFECAALIDAGDSDAVARAFIAPRQGEACLVVSRGSDPELRPQLRYSCCSRNVALSSRHWEIEK